MDMDFGVRVGVVIERSGALLLVRHEKPDRDPYWVLPGGRLEPGETIPACAEAGGRRRGRARCRLSRSALPSVSSFKKTATRSILR